MSLASPDWRTRAEAYERWVFSVAHFERDHWDRTWPTAYRAISESILEREARGRPTSGPDAFLRALVFGQRTFHLLHLVLAPGWANGQRIVDAGSGTGPVALAAWAEGAESIACWETGRAELAWLREGSRHADNGWEIVNRSLKGAVEPAEADFLVLGFSFLEAFGDDLVRAERWLRPWLDAGRRVLILEPGTHRSGRRLQELRDRLPDWVVAPCRGARACPRLADAADWCHFRWRRPLGPTATKVLQAAGRRPHTLALAYLLLGPRSAVARQSPDHWRLLEVQRRGRRRVDLRLCGPEAEVLACEVPFRPPALHAWGDAREPHELVAVGGLGSGSRAGSSLRLRACLPALDGRFRFT